MFNRSSVVISKCNYTVTKLDFKIVMWLKAKVFFCDMWSINSFNKYL